MKGYLQSNPLSETAEVEVKTALNIHTTATSWQQCPKEWMSKALQLAVSPANFLGFDGIKEWVGGQSVQREAKSP